MSSSSENAIRWRRAAFNRALAEADIKAIGPILAQDAIMVTGTDSGVIAGRKAQLAAWKTEFSALSRVFYTRTPDSIVLSPVEPIAMEHGHWQGVDAAGAPIASGQYSAKWRKQASHWVIEAEIYLTLA